jgi:hypothetical protein
LFISIIVGFKEPGQVENIFIGAFTMKFTVSRICKGVDVFYVLGTYPKDQKATKQSEKVSQPNNVVWHPFQQYFGSIIVEDGTVKICANYDLQAGEIVELLDHMKTKRIRIPASNVMTTVIQTKIKSRNGPRKAIGRATVKKLPKAEPVSKAMEHIDDCSKAA